ncbi:hypothetical protein GBF38_013974, partial [Nibea albiflora]
MERPSAAQEKREKNDGEGVNSYSLKHGTIKESFIATSISQVINPRGTVSTDRDHDDTRIWSEEIRKYTAVRSS